MQDCEPKFLLIGVLCLWPVIKMLHTWHLFFTGLLVLSPVVLLLYLLGAFVVGL